MRMTDILLSPHGRISRLGFWGGWLMVLFIIVMATVALMTLAQFATDNSLGFDMPQVWIALLLAVPAAWMSLCLLVKRWHDQGRSGWWVLALLVPVIGPMWTLFACGFQRGTPGANRYGPAPDQRRYDHALQFGDEIPEDMA